MQVILPCRKEALIHLYSTVGSKDHGSNFQVMEHRGKGTPGLGSSKRTGVHLKEKL